MKRGWILWFVYELMYIYAVTMIFNMGADSSEVAALFILAIPIIIHIYKKYFSKKGKEEREIIINRQVLTLTLIKFIFQNGGLRKLEAYKSEGYFESMTLTNKAGQQIKFSLNEHGLSKTRAGTIGCIFDKLSVVFNGIIIRKYAEHKATGIHAISYAMYGDSEVGTVTGVILYSKKEYRRMQQENEEKRKQERYEGYRPL